MAIIATIKTMYGNTEELYIRVSEVTASNHGVPAKALIRGFVSRQAWVERSHFKHEEWIEFTSDVSIDQWIQAYSALTEKYPDSVFAGND